MLSFNINRKKCPRKDILMFWLVDEIKWYVHKQTEYSLLIAYILFHLLSFIFKSSFFL